MSESEEDAVDLMQDAEDGEQQQQNLHVQNEIERNEDNENNNVVALINNLEEDDEEFNDDLGVVILDDGDDPDRDNNIDNPYFHRIIVDSDDDGDLDSSDTDADRMEDNTTEPRHERLEPTRGNVAQFDNELPARHSYLGEGMEELQGRTIWEDGEILTHEIPIVAMNLALVPGQTLPLTIFHAVFQNAIRRCVAKDRVFGIVQMDTDHFPGHTVSRGALGTLAEIYEFQEESDVENPFVAPMSASFALKAKGRSRFLVLSVRRQGDGNLMGKVRILPEVRLGQYLNHVTSHGTMRYIFPQLQMCTPENESGSVSSRRSSISSLFSRSVSSSSRASTAGLMILDCNGFDKTVVRKNRVKHEDKMNRYCSALTPWPSFVYNHYSDNLLVDRIHRKLKDLKGLMATAGTSIPTDPTDLSFWIAQNLTMEDSIRKAILRMDSPIERLQYELTILERLCPVMTCAHCNLSIANRKDIFSMSVEGPSGNYVNPHGIVHETITVTKVKGAVSVGASSTEASWFPGYAWTILQCRQCTKHLGWKFKAEGGRLKPKKFFGLTRKSVRHDFESISDQEDI